MNFKCFIHNMSKEKCENNKTETPENRTTRLEKMRVRMAVARATETFQRRQIRLEKQRVRTAMSRATESDLRRNSRLEKQRIRTALSRAGETEEQRQTRLQQNRTSVALARATETTQHREARLQRQRIRTAFIRSMKRQVLSKSKEVVSQHKRNEVEPSQAMNIFTNVKQNELIESNTIRLNDKYMFGKETDNIKCEFGKYNRSFTTKCANSPRYKCEFCNSSHFTLVCPVMSVNNTS